MVIYIRWTVSLSRLDPDFSGLSFCQPARCIGASQKKIDIRLVHISPPFYAGLVSPYYLSRCPSGPIPPPVRPDIPPLHCPAHVFRPTSVTLSPPPTFLEYAPTSPSGFVSASFFSPSTIRFRRVLRA
jgi:hypothetical protein